MKLQLCVNWNCMFVSVTRDGSCTFLTVDLHQTHLFELQHWSVLWYYSSPWRRRKQNKWRFFSTQSDCMKTGKKNSGWILHINEGIWACTVGQSLTALEVWYVQNTHTHQTMQQSYMYWAITQAKQTNKAHISILQIVFIYLLIWLPWALIYLLKRTTHEVLPWLR